MQILFSGNLTSLFNVNGCSQLTSEDMQVLVFGFGYSTNSNAYVNIPLPPGNQMLSLKEVPDEFFPSLERCFASERDILYRHRFEVLKSCDLTWNEHESGRCRYMSFDLPVGEWRFGPVAMFMPSPKPNAVWLPQTTDKSMCSYVVSPSDIKPVGKWTRSPHQLALTTQSEKVGNVLDMGAHVWRHLDQPPSIVEFTANKARHGN